MNVKLLTTLAIAFQGLLANHCLAQTNVAATTDAPKLSPVLAKPGRLAFGDDFQKPHRLDKANFLPRQGTQWAIKNGVLRGAQSSEEFQSNRDHHLGLEPRLSMPVTPREFVFSFDFRFIDGKETTIVPFVEFGHHVCRVRFSKSGLALLAEGEKLTLDEAKSFVWESGKWYQAIAEMKGDAFSFQIAGGPMLQARHASFAKAPKSGAAGFGIAGPRKGFVELDNIKIYNIKKAK